MLHVVTWPQVLNLSQWQIAQSIIHEKWRRPAVGMQQAENEPCADGNEQDAPVVPTTFACWGRSWFTSCGDHKTAAVPKLRDVRVKIVALLFSLFKSDNSGLKLIAPPFMHLLRPRWPIYGGIQLIGIFMVIVTVIAQLKIELLEEEWWFLLRVFKCFTTLNICDKANLYRS